MTKWYDRRPFCDITTERSSLYSVIIVSSEADARLASLSAHENSKIALPVTESATPDRSWSCVFPSKPVGERVFSGHGRWW